MSDRDIVCYILLKDVSESFTKGCLVCYKDKTKTSQVYIPYFRGGGGGNSRTSNIASCTCSEGDVMPVYADDYKFICRINNPEDRYNVFMSPYKLKWAKNLKVGDQAYAKLRSDTEGKYIAVEVRWVGQTKIGMKIGVEITDSAYRGQGDASVNNYFRCEEKCGMLLDLDALECHKLVHPTVNWTTKATAMSSPAVSSTAVSSPAVTSPALGQADTKVAVKDRTVDELKKENKRLLEENAQLKQKYEEANHVRVTASQAEIERQLSLHQTEVKTIEEGWEEQVKVLKESEARLQNELIKKAENYAAELKEIFDSQQLLLRKNEKEHQDLIQELNEHFQSEIKAAHAQWQQAINNMWEVDQSEIDLSDEELGKGKLGTVFKGSFRGIQVAVKKMYPGLISEQTEKVVKWEFALLSQIRHPDILLFLGATMALEESLSLVVTELMDTSLNSAYQQHKISARNKLLILSDVASALLYLHTSRVPIIHGKISSSKVLLKSVGGTNQWKAKLSIFGIANMVPTKHSSGDQGSLYSAPEVIASNRRELTEKVDVYSFGVLICEVILCRPPPEDRKQLPVMLSDVRVKDHNLFQLAMNCIMLSHRNRPPMKEVIENLKALLEHGNLISITPGELEVNPAST